MTDIAIAHPRLESFCRKDGQQMPGIAIGFEIVEFLVKAAIKRADTYGPVGQ